ncbi:hypothetical protein HPP92_022740 [Vanilla planifolia]|uniref:MORF/ORRM1/DAG-like MORF domain-containing protein n=1 Tax=Vanilla planifolia TaxID=51239 RepID=A0A835Q170_VANPL|nr:hypothetical protein HPP92_023038 [Vanilla planifolia]KAG0459612.1 hypothetical protein HPP92_022740 [Vanilla planifolia]
MATACSLISRLRTLCFLPSRVLGNRSLMTLPPQVPRIRPLVSVTEGLRFMIDSHGAASRCFTTRSTTSSIQDPSPNWSNRPPKETILLDGCDFEHWLVVVEKPDEKLTRDEIIDSYIKTLAQVVGSEEEARMKIYSVSTKHYFAFGALVSEELSYKLKALPNVRWVLPDSYLDVKNKDYGGEPFINGQAVPYDPKYHEEWVRNNARANERSRRQDRPRNYDRSRNFERRRENMQNREFLNRDAPPMPNLSNASSPTPPGQNIPQNTSPQMPPNSNAYANQMPNAQTGHGYQAGPPGGPGYQAGPPGGQSYQAGPPGGQGYQAGPPGGQGYQAGPPGGQGYQVGSSGGHGYQASPPGVGQGYQASAPGSQGFQSASPGGQGYQSGLGYQSSPLGGPGYQPGSQGYQSGPASGQGYQGGPPGGQGYQTGPPGAQGYQGGQHGGLGSGYQVNQPSPFQGGNPSFQGGYQSGNTGSFRGPASNGFQSSNFAQSQNGGNNEFHGTQSAAADLQGQNPTNQARDVPGRDV